MSESPIISIQIKFWKQKEGMDDIEERERTTGHNFSNLDKDMYLIGEFFINNELKGTIGKKIESWAISKNAPIVIDKISYDIYKIFDEKNKWIGTIEERLIDEIMLSIRSDPKLVFSVSLKNYNHSFNILQRSDFFVFPFLTSPKSSNIEFFIFDKKTVSFGSDWDVKRCILAGYKIGLIDSKGSRKIKINIYNEDLANNLEFIHYLILFSVTIPFHKDIKERIKGYTRYIKEGDMLLQVNTKVLGQYIDTKDKKIKIKQTEIKKQIESEKLPTKEKIKPKELEQEIIPKTESEIKKIIRKDLEESSTELIVVESEEPREKEEELGVKTIETKSETIELSFKIEDPIEKAPGIGKKTGARFREIGIKTIGDFLNADIDDLYEQLSISWITKSKLRKWQKICFDNIV